MADHDDFEERFPTLALLAYQVAYRLTGDRQESQDAAQEALARAFVRWPRIRAYAEAWVVRVTTNLVIGRWRRPTPRPPSPPLVEGGDERSVQRLALAEALRLLPRRQREAAVLRFLGDLTIEQAAVAMGCSPSAVKGHSERALGRLRRALGDDRALPAPAEPRGADLTMEVRP